MPRYRRASPQQPHVKRAIEDVEQKLWDRWPDASFVVRHGEDPEAVYLDATVNADFWDVIDAIDELQQQIFFERRVPLFVVPVLPTERVEQQWRARAESTARQTASG